MSVFKVSGFGDWDTTDVGETLCENFKKVGLIFYLCKKIIVERILVFSLI